jgi:toxin YoeB
MKLKTYWINNDVKRSFYALKDEAKRLKKRNIKNEITAEFDRLKELYSDICNSPYSGKGVPHPLKHDFPGMWARSITRMERVVYKVDIQNKILYIAELHIDYHSTSSAINDGSFLDELLGLSEDETNLLQMKSRSGYA